MADETEFNPLANFGSGGLDLIETRLKVSSNDTTQGFLEDKLVASQGSNAINVLELSTLNDGADEDRQLQIDVTKIDHDQLLNFLANEHIDWTIDQGATDINVANLPAHASLHENGGADEINVGGLSGLLADAQTPLSHASSHQNGGSDEVNVAGLSGLLADGQTPLAHKTSHENGGSDEISVAGLSGVLAAGQPVTIEDEGTPLANTPHTVLNFTGAGVVASDAGAGEATINIGAGTGDINVDGGRADSVYLPVQNIDGGSA